MRQPRTICNGARRLKAICDFCNYRCVFAEAGMRKMMIFIGTTIGGYAGWYLGNLVGFMTAFVLSMVGTGLGMYFAVRAARNYE